MTQHGDYRAMNRLGKSASSTVYLASLCSQTLISGITSHGSPYLKMSFETTTRFLTSAVLANEADSMVSAVSTTETHLFSPTCLNYLQSARIVMGRVVDSGTGAFDLWQPLNRS